MSEPLLFLLPALGYILAGAACVLTRLRRGLGTPSWVDWLLWGCLGVHAVLIAARGYPETASLLASARELTLLISWLLVVAYLVTARWLRGSGVAGPILGGAGAALALATAALPARPEAVPPILVSPWLILHVPLCTAAYLLYALAGSAGVMYLVVSSLLKARRPLALSGSMPTLESLDRFSHRMATLGFPLLTAGLMAGMLWSNEVWGQLLPVTPKQMIALANWAIYAAYLHARLGRGVRGRLCAWLLVGGFVLVIVGLLIPVVSSGPHKFV